MSTDIVVAPESKNQKKPTEKQLVSNDLSDRIFDELTRVVNVRDCGHWWDGSPRHSITKELSHQFNCVWPEDPSPTRNKIVQKYFAGKLNKYKVRRHLNATGKEEQGYYTSRNKNFCMPMGDFDAHNGEQDCEDAMQLVKDNIWNDVYENGSQNGGHHYFLFKHSNGVFTNTILKKAKSVISDFLDWHGIQTEFEIKGNCTVFDEYANWQVKSGDLAALPYIKTEVQFKQFCQLPIIDIKHFEKRIDEVAASLVQHQEVIKANRAKRKARKEAWKAGVEYVEAETQLPEIVVTNAKAVAPTMSDRQRPITRLASSADAGLYEQWLRGGSCAFERDKYFLTALSRQLNYVPSVDDAVKAKEHFGCFAGEFDETKAGERLGFWHSIFESSFKPLQKRNGGFPVLEICEYAKRKIHEGRRLPYVVKKDSFDESGMPIVIRETISEIEVGKQELRQIFTAIKDCEANRDENDGVSFEFIRKTIKAQPWKISNLDRKIKVVVDWMESENLIDIYDHDFKVGKCRRWNTVDLSGLLKKWKGFKKRIRQQELLKLSISLEMPIPDTRNQFNPIRSRIGKPPD